MADFITFPWLPSWFEWNPYTEEGRTLDRQVGAKCGSTKTVKGRDPLPWHTDNEGRPFIKFSVDVKQIALYKHELIWMTHYNRPIPKGYQIHHIDFNKHNNNIENLQMLTETEHRKLHAKTRECCQKNNAITSKAVIALDEKGNVVHRFASTMEARRQGFCQVAVAAACRGCYSTHRGHYYKGLWWYYEQEWLRLQ